MSAHARLRVCVNVCTGGLLIESNKPRMHRDSRVQQGLKVGGQGEGGGAESFSLKPVEGPGACTFHISSLKYFCWFPLELQSEVCGLV